MQTVRLRNEDACHLIHLKLIAWLERGGKGGAAIWKQVSLLAVN